MALINFNDLQYSAVKIPDFTTRSYPRSKSRNLNEGHSGMSVKGRSQCAKFIHLFIDLICSINGDMICQQCLV